MKNLVLFAFITVLSLGGTKAQDAPRFEKEINTLALKKAKSDKDLILFVGSSSFRMWKSLEEDIIEQEALNLGFGGSMMKDVNINFASLIYPYQAKMIFVYEGDNDIALGEEKKAILKEYKRFLKKVKKKDKTIKVILLSAKPSPSRWEFKPSYEELNASIEKLSKKKRVYYLDVWTPMLLSDGEVDPSLFITDRLHMNSKGYEIWLNLVKEMIAKANG